MSDRCSLASRAAGIPLAGTAPQTPAWLVVEQRIPWAARALESERLDDHLRSLLVCVPATVLLARWQGAAGPERFWYSAAASSGLISGYVSELVDVLSAGSPLATMASTLPVDPVLFVCANSKRDVCCAIESKPLLAQLSERADVWQCTHIGGHRFAPTALLLPTAMVYGRLTAEIAVAALDFASRDEVETTYARGYSWLTSLEQIADIHVRRRYQITCAHSLTFEASDADTSTPQVTVRHTDGRSWQVLLQRRQSEPVLEACGRDPLSETYYSLESIAAVS
ncbi:unannotated protein [freshwater metagenome]|uniref:Unannotated protein n=1 Tax=freshwater metagenome TaxID=449393 RepID=A0A6J7G295_9ZZZZ